MGACHTFLTVAGIYHPLLDIYPSLLLVLKTFKIQLPSECSQLRYTSDILEYLFKSYLKFDMNKREENESER